MPEPESAPPLGEQPGQTVTPTSEVHGGVPEDPLAETASRHADTLEPTPQPTSMDTQAPPEYRQVPMARPDLAPSVLSGADSGTPASSEGSVTHIPVVEHPDEKSEETPPSTQPAGLAPDPLSAGTSLMDKMTDHEPTAGPEVPTGGQMGVIQEQTQVTPQPGEENGVNAEKESGLEPGKASNELLLSRQKELFEQVDMHTEMLREAITELKEINQKLASKESSIQAETRPVA